MVIDLQHMLTAEPSASPSIEGIFPDSMLHNAIEAIWRASPDLTTVVASDALQGFSERDWLLFAFVDVSSWLGGAVEAIGTNDDMSLRIAIGGVHADLLVRSSEHSDVDFLVLLTYPGYSKRAGLTRMERQILAPRDCPKERDAGLFLRCLSDVKYHYDSLLYLPLEMRRDRVQEMAQRYEVSPRQLGVIDHLVRQA